MIQGGDGGLSIEVQMEQFEKMPANPFDTREGAEGFVRFLDKTFNQSEYGKYPFNNRTGYVKFQITESEDGKFYIWYRIDQKEHTL